MSCNNKRVGILMMNTPNVSKYAHIATFINYKYCSKHGYAFIVERCPSKRDMNKNWMWDNKNEYLIVWSKPVMIKRHLSNYDYLLVIDSDAVFLDQEKKVESFVNSYIDDKICMITGQDCLKEGHCFDASHLNAGVILVINKKKTFEILDRWIAGADKECVDWKYQHPREQMCLQILKDLDFQQEIKIISHKEINGLDGLWIRHYMTMTSEQRLSLMDKHFFTFFANECHSTSTGHLKYIIIIIICILSICLYMIKKPNPF